MSRSGPPVSPEARDASKVRCQCGHIRSEHFYVRKSGRFALCRRCTCPEHIEGEFKFYPKATEVVVQLEDKVVSNYEICSDCGQSRKCIEGICDSCADALVGL